MADIFISYSSKDREKAEQLTELLSSAGLSVWIDKQGIGAATSWSEEIVHALDACKALVVMLSPSSIESKNVVREVALAFEKNKKILPLDLEPVSLPPSMQYHLAGIQRTPMTNIDSIIRALGKIGLEATGAPTMKLVKETDARKSLMILPFEDLSPTGDNQWFADGLATELISALSNVKSLRVTDQQTTKEFRNFKGHLTTYAQEMSIRYFIQGSVRKFGDQIKIASSLLDIESGEHLWQDSLKGTMDDIFEIQEKVAEKVVEGLKIHLGSEEKKEIAERETQNADAYEFLLKARQYIGLQTKEGYEFAVQLFSEAIALDPTYMQASLEKASALAHLYRMYLRDPALLDEGLSLVQEALRSNPENPNANTPLVFILFLQGNIDEAENVAKSHIQKVPDDSQGYYLLGFIYWETNKFSDAIALYEEVLTRRPDDLSIMWNLATAYDFIKETAKQKALAQLAIPKIEKYLKLFPEDESKWVQRAVLFHFAGRDDEAREAIRKLDNLKDARSLYEAACLYCQLKNYDHALSAFHRAINARFCEASLLKGFLDDEDGGIGLLKGTPEWEEARELVEEITTRG